MVSPSKGVKRRATPGALINGAKPLVRLCVVGVLIGLSDIKGFPYAATVGRLEGSVKRVFLARQRGGACLAGGLEESGVEGRRARLTAGNKETFTIVSNKKK